MENKKHISFDQAGNKLPFTVPEDYFEKFALNMDAHIAVKQVPVFHFMRPWMYAAAIMLGVIFIGKGAYNVYQNKQLANTENYELYVLSQVDEDDIIDYYLSDEANLQINKK